ncbi:MAG: type II secretion system F family protein [Candidatus Diapherotrites archaeon]|nr:type II secretion system F family protein [Candidatus Diapherotrites archaeon]
MDIYALSQEYWSKAKNLASRYGFELKAEHLYYIFGGFMLIISLLVAFLFFFGTDSFFNWVFIGLIVGFGPLAYHKYNDYMRIERIEESFPVFLRDISESKRAGMTLPKAVYATSTTYYGDLSIEVKKISNQISWGVPFSKAIKDFADRTDSKIIKRSVSIILEAHRSGGSIADILETVAIDAQKIKQLEAERKGNLQIYTYTMYFIYVVFLGIVAVLQLGFIPALPRMAGLKEILGGGAVISEGSFRTLLMNLALIQAFFNGLVAGIMSEGRAIAGLKHAFILVFIGFFVFQFFVPVPNPVARISEVVLILPPGSEDMKVAIGSYYLTKDIHREDISRHLNKMSETAEPYDQWIKGLVSNDFAFRDSGVCVPCKQGDLAVRPNYVKVVKPAEVFIELLYEDKKWYVQLT